MLRGIRRRRAILSQPHGGGGLVLPYSGSQWALDFINGIYRNGDTVQPNHTTVAGYTAIGFQNVTSGGLLCAADADTVTGGNQPGGGRLTSPALPTGDWTMVLEGQDYSGNEYAAIATLSDGTTSNELKVYLSSVAVGIKLTTSGVTRFEDGVESGPRPTAPIRVVVTKNGTAVRVATNGQDAKAIGTWTAFTPTQLKLGDEGTGASVVYPLNSRFRAAVLYAAGMTDAQIKALSVPGFFQ